MADEVYTSIAQLRALAPKLNEATDSATKAVQRVEKFLNEEQRIGLPVYVTIDYSSPDDDAPGTQLGYDRHGDKFRIVVRDIEYFVDDGELRRQPQFGYPIIKGSEVIAWSECPRALKLQSFKKLPDLLRAVEKRVRDEIKAAAESEVAVDDLLAALDGRPSHPKDEPDENQDDSLGDEPNGRGPSPRNNGFPGNGRHRRF